MPAMIVSPVCGQVETRKVGSSFMNRFSPRPIRSWSAELAGASDRLMSGETFAQAMAATGIFPANSIEMLAVGEKTGELDVALHNIAGYFERTNGEKVDDAISTIEPALTLSIGIAIGFIALAIITPIYSLAGGM